MTLLTFEKFKQLMKDFKLTDPNVLGKEWGKEGGREKEKKKRAIK